MKKGQIILEEYKNPMGIHTITINNARYYKNSIKELMQFYLKDKIAFLGFCRMDGVNLSTKTIKELRTKIPLFFREYGDMQNLNEYLSIAKASLGNAVFDFFPDVFDYYLDTIVFNPKVDWKTFKQYYSNYQEHRFEDIILDHLAEILFCYSDSGDFSICFSSEFYSYTDVKKLVGKIFMIE